jgi:hypothetical protein
MFTINLKGQNYNIDFEHITPQDKNWGHWKGKHGELKGITRCILSKESDEIIGGYQKEYDEEHFGIKEGFKLVSVDVAKCSYEDVFEKRQGRKIALSRSLKGMNLTKEERKQIWDKYFSMVKK